MRSKLVQASILSVLLVVSMLSGCGGTSTGPAASLGTPSGQANPATVTLSGRIVDSVTQSAVGGAEITPLEGGTVQGTAEGTFALQVGTGTAFYLRVGAPGYQETLVGGRLGTDSAVPAVIPLAKIDGSAARPFPMAVTLGDDGTRLMEGPAPLQATGSVSKAVSVTSQRWYHLSFPKTGITAFTASVPVNALTWYDPTAHTMRYIIADTTTGTINSGGSYLDPAHGYWTLGTSTGTLDAVGTDVTGDSTLALGGGFGSVTQQWNLVGCPYGQSVSLSSLQISRNSTTYDLSSASANGIAAPALSWWNADYNGGAGRWEYSTYPGGTLEPNRGYWYLVYQDCSLTIPKPGAVASVLLTANLDATLNSGGTVKATTFSSADLLDTTGAVVKTGTASGTQATFDISSLTTGTYFIQVNGLPNDLVPTKIDSTSTAMTQYIATTLRRSTIGTNSLTTATYVFSTYAQGQTQPAMVKYTDGTTATPTRYAYAQFQPASRVIEWHVLGTGTLLSTFTASGQHTLTTWVLSGHTAANCNNSCHGTYTTKASTFGSINTSNGWCYKCHYGSGGSGSGMIDPNQ